MSGICENKPGPIQSQTNSEILFRKPGRSREPLLTEVNKGPGSAEERLLQLIGPVIGGHLVALGERGTVEDRLHEIIERPLENHDVGAPNLTSRDSRRVPLRRARLRRSTSLPSCR